MGFDATEMTGFKLYDLKKIINVRAMTVLFLTLERRQVNFNTGEMMVRFLTLERRQVNFNTREMMVRFSNARRMTARF